MAITNGYIDIDILAYHLADDGPPADGSEDEAAMERAISAASRWIDLVCGRRFYVASEARYYTAKDSSFFYCDDLISVSELAVDDTIDGSYDTTFESTEYWLMPFNAAVKYQPYNSIRLSPVTTSYFPTQPRGIKLTGRFGWAFGDEDSEVAPAGIIQACVQQSARLYERKGAIFGVKGSTQLGIQFLQSVPRDIDVMNNLEPFIKRI